MTSHKDKALAADLAAELARAEAFMWAEMEKLGLRAEDGWTITEITRERAGGSELVLRPMHLRLHAPEGLECVVRIVEKDAAIDRECSTPVETGGS